MYICMYICTITTNIYGGFPDSMYKNGCGAENRRKHTLRFEKALGFNVTKTYPLACVLRRGMLKGMLTPRVRIVSDTPCFRVCLPPLARSGFKGYALGYALGMFSCVVTVISFG